MDPIGGFCPKRLSVILYQNTRLLYITGLELPILSFNLSPKCWGPGLCCLTRGSVGLLSYHTELTELTHSQLLVSCKGYNTDEEMHRAEHLGRGTKHPSPFQVCHPLETSWSSWAPVLGIYGGLITQAGHETPATNDQFTQSLSILQAWVKL